MTRWPRWPARAARIGVVTLGAVTLLVARDVLERGHDVWPPGATTTAPMPRDTRAPPMATTRPPVTPVAPGGDAPNEVARTAPDAVDRAAPQPGAAPRARARSATARAPAVTAIDPGGMVLVRKPRAQGPQSVILSLRVNEQAHGEVVVVLGADGDATVAEADLRAAGFVGALPVQDGQVSLRALGARVQFVVDADALALRVTADPTLFGERLVAVGSDRPAGLVVAADTSGFLNYAVHGDDDQHFALFTELGLRLGPTLTTSTFTVDSAPRLSGDGTNLTAVRGQTQVVVDDLDARVRWTLGDTLATGAELGGATFVGGLTFARQLALDPYLPTAPPLAFDGAAAMPSTLDVYIDGVFSRRIDVPVGVFRVEDLAGPSGHGNVRYEMRDALGNTKSVTEDYAIGARALAPGLHDYAYSVGFERHDQAHASFDYREPVVTGRHRVGVTRALTVGWNVEAAPLRGLYDVGASADLATPLGEVDVAVSAGLTGEYAAMVRYSVASGTVGFAMRAATRSPHFATLALAPEADRDLVVIGGKVHWSSGPWRASLEGSYAEARDAGPRATGRIGAGFSFGHGITLTANAGVTSDRTGTGFDAMAVITITPGRRLTASLSESVHDGDTETMLSATVPTRSHEDAGIQARVTLGRGTPHLIAMPRFETEIMRIDTMVGYDAGGLHASADMAGGVAFLAGSGVFLTRPITEGYAVIEVPDEVDVRAFRDNRPAGSTHRGNLLIPDLLPHYGNRLSVDARDLGLDFSLDTTERLVAPPYRGGARVSFGMRRTAYVRGHLVIDAVPVVYGRIQVGTHGSPLGRGGEFEFEGLAPGRYRGRAETAQGTCQVEFVVGDPPAAIVDLGVLTCTR